LLNKIFTFRFKKSKMVLLEDGGAWAAHTAQVCAEKLDVVTTSVDKIKEKQTKLLQKLKDEYSKKIDSLLATLSSRIPHHLEDITFLEASYRERDASKRFAPMKGHS
jgi:hypothetical protein